MSEPLETISETYRGHEILVNVYRDDHMGPPWEEHDGHGEVSDLTTRDKRPGELLLCQYRNLKRFYDYEGAVLTAKVEGWQPRQPNRYCLDTGH